MKSNEIARRQYSDRFQSEFSHRYACWANNHNGWSKMKKLNRRLFKKKFRREMTSYHYFDWDDGDEFEPEEDDDEEYDEFN